MPDEIGPHLLGWNKPEEKDERDYKMADYLDRDESADDPTAVLDDALAALEKSKSVAQGTKDFGAAVVNFLKGVTPTPDPTPTPTPTPTPADSKQWADAHQLDQGDTPHCVGFGGAQYHNAEPVPGSYTDDDGHKIYYECKVIDGEPKQEDGSTVHSLAKALKNRKLLSTYVWAASTDDIKSWVLKNGPVVVGTDFYNDMFNPDSDGFVTPTGGIAGGHCYLVVGYYANGDYFVFQNSWGSSWGQNGYFKMKVSDFRKLLNADGEAMAAAEV
jgi:hypothetical protein